MTRADLRKKLKQEDNTLNYQTKIILDACNGADFAKYFKLVNLAIQIK